MQKSLLAVSDDLPLKKAVDQALAYEAADKSMKNMQGGHSGQAPAVNKALGSFSRRSKSCYRCGKGNHSPSNCRYRDFVCDNHGKRGHLAKVYCADPRQGPKPKGAKWVDVKSDSEDVRQLCLTMPFFVLKTPKCTL